MTTTINADTIVGGAVVTADASGVLGLQAAGNTGITLNSSRAIGVGASPSYGTAGQVLTSAGSAAAPTWSANSPTTSATANGSIAAGAPVIVDTAGTVSSIVDTAATTVTPYGVFQSAADTSSNGMGMCLDTKRNQVISIVYASGVPA